MYVKQPWNNLYNLKVWKVLRLKVFIRDQYICQICGKVTHTNHKHPHAAIADHIIPHKGDETLFFDIDNIQTLGKSCHDSIKQSMDKGGKPKQFIGEDGWPIINMIRQTFAQWHHKLKVLYTRVKYKTPL